jgi:hypothetical protein
MPQELYRAVSPEGKTVEMHAGVIVPGFEGVGEDISSALKAAGKVVKGVVAPAKPVKPARPPITKGNIIQRTRDAAINALAGTKTGKTLAAARDRLRAAAKRGEVALFGKPPKEALVEVPGGARALADIAGQPGVEMRFWTAASRLATKVRGIIGKGPESRRAMEAVEGTRSITELSRPMQRKVKHAIRFQRHLETLMVDVGLHDEATILQRQGKYLRPVFKEYDSPGVIQKFKNLWHSRSFKMSKQFRRKYETLAEYEKVGLHPKEDLGYTLLKDWVRKGTDISKGLAIQDIAGIETLVQPTGKAPPDWVKVPKVKGWGALGGQMVHPDLHAVLSGEGYGPPVKQMGTAVGRWLSRQRKATATYRNIPRHVRQFLENAGAADVNADIDPVTGFNKHYIGTGKGIATNAPWWQEFKAQSGLKDTDYWSQMIRRTRAIKATNFAELSKAISGAYSGGGILVKGYRFGDTFFKAMIWRKIRMEGGSNAQAIKAANDAIVNFDHVPPRLRNFEKAWYGPMFLSARYVAARNMLRAATTPRGMLKLAKWAAIGSGITYYTMKALGLTEKQIDDIKQAKRIGGVSVPLPWKHGGKPQFVDITHLTGGGEELDLAGAMATLNKENVEQKVKDYANQLLGSSPLFTMLMEAKSGKDAFTGRWVYTPGAGLVRQSAEFTAAQTKKFLVPWYMQRAAQAVAGGKPLRFTKDILGLPIRVGEKPLRARRILKKRARKRKKAEKRPFRAGVGPQLRRAR